MKKPEFLTDEQMKELERFVCDRERISDFAKKAIIWLLRQSENLTKEVSLKFPESPKRVRNLGRAFAFAAHDISLNNLIKEMGGSMVLYGYNSETAGLGASLAFKYYSKGEETLLLDINEIKAINLT